jgi:hypothetical protein
MVKALGCRGSVDRCRGLCRPMTGRSRNLWPVTARRTVRVNGRWRERGANRSPSSLGKRRPWRSVEVVGIAVPAASRPSCSCPSRCARCCRMEGGREIRFPERFPQPEASVPARGAARPSAGSKAARSRPLPRSVNRCRNVRICRVPRALQAMLAALALAPSVPEFVADARRDLMPPPRRGGMGLGSALPWAACLVTESVYATPANVELLLIAVASPVRHRELWRPEGPLDWPRISRSANPRRSEPRSVPTSGP